MSNSSAIRMGRAFVEFFTDTSGITKGLNAAKKQLTSFGSAVASMGAGIAGIGATITAPLAKLFTDAAERGRDMQSLASQFNMSVPAVSKLAAGFETAGISLEGFEGTLTGLQSQLFNNSKIFAELGMSAFQLSRIPIGSALEEIAERISHMGSATEQTIAATEIFGSSWRQLMPYLQRGAVGIRELNEAGSGLELDTESAKRGAEAMKGLTRIWMEFKYALLEVGNALLPTGETIKSAVTWIKKAGTGLREFITQNKETIKVVAAVGAGLLIAGTAMTTLGAIAIGAGAVIGGVVTGIGGLVSAFSSIIGLATSWPLLLGAAAGGIAAYFAIQSNAGQKSLGILKDGFNEVKDTAISAWEGIGDAIKQGDFALAFEIAVQGVKVVWAETVSAFTDMWNAFKDSIVDGWEDTINEIRKRLSALKNGGLSAGISIKGSGGGGEGGGGGGGEGEGEGEQSTLGKVGGWISDAYHAVKNELGRGTSLKPKTDAEMEADKAERHDARKTDSDAAKSDKEREKLKLENLRLKAGSYTIGPIADKPSLTEGLPSRDSVMGLGSSVKGTSNITSGASAAMQLGAGDQINTRFFADIAKNTDDTKKAIEKVAPDVAAAILKTTACR